MLSTKNLTLLLTSLIVTGLTIGLRSTGKLEGLELGAYDQLMRARPIPKPDNRILVVGINDTDIQARKEYPITDNTLALAFTKLQQYQPRVIGLDIARDVQQGSATGRQALVEQLSKSENIVAACKLSDTETPGIAPAPGVPEDRVGIADLALDPGGTLRRAILISIPKASRVELVTKHICNHVDPENQLPSISLQMVVRYLEPLGIHPQPTSTGELKFGSTILRRLTPSSGGYHHADTGDYQILLNYRSAQNAFKQVSLLEVLNDKVDPALIKDRIVMIGYTAPIVKDDFYTPYSRGAQDNQKMPGVIVHAQNTSQILSAVLDHRPLIWYWNDGQEILWIFGWSLLGGILAWQIRKPWFLIIAEGIGIAILFGSTFTIFLQAGWIPLVPPVLGLIATGVSVVLIDRYSATIVKTVKGILKIDIDIDQQKKDEDIEAIVETDFFAELKQQAKNLRTGDNNEITPQPIEEPAQPIQQEEPVQPIQPIQKQIEEVDYLEQVRLRRLAKENTNPVTPAEEVDVTQQEEEQDYWENLKAKTKQAKEKKQNHE